MRKIILLPVFILFTALNLSGFDLKEAKSLNSMIGIENRISSGGKYFTPFYSEDTDKLYLFSEDSRLYIYKSGRLIRKIKLTSSPRFSPAEGRDGTFYCYFSDRTLRAYNRGGKLLWLVKQNKLPMFPPLVNSSGNIVLFCSGNTVKSYALNGRLRWEKKVEINQKINPVSAYRGIIYHDNSKFMYITDRGKTGSVPEQKNTVSFFSVSGYLFKVDRIPVSGGKASGTADANTAGSDTVKSRNKENCEVSLLDRNFREKWSVKTDSVPEDIKINSRIIYLLTSESTLYRIDKSGTILKKKKLSGGGGKFTVLDNYIYLINRDSHVRIYSRDLEFLDRIAVPGESVHGFSDSSGGEFPSPCYAGENSMVFGGLDWILYFFRVNDKDRSVKEKYPLNSESSGNNLSASLRYINELSLSERYENRLKSLSLIEDLIQEGGMSGYEYEILDILFRLGTEGTVTINRNNSSNDGGALMRSRASSLIYSAGTVRSLSMIRKMINAENDEYVIIKDIELLGKGGSDPDLQTFNAFKDVLERTDYDRRICTAVADAASDIASYNGYLPAEYSRLLLGIMDIHKDSELKNKIIRLLVKKQY